MNDEVMSMPENNRVPLRIRFAPIRPAYVLALFSLIALLIFMAVSAVFVWQNSHFIGDDYDHFADVLTKSLLELLLTPIDVHFVPLHQLASYLLFKTSALNFGAAVVAMTLCWLASVALLHLVLRRLVNSSVAWMITVFIGVSPAWLHILIWWSGAAHRIPYLLLQAAALLFYLRFRDGRFKRDAFLAGTVQLMALGFYVKAVLFPVVIVALEICLVLRFRRFSKPAIALCLGMILISAIYLFWYLVFSPTMRSPNELGVYGTFLAALLFLSRLGSLLILLPIESYWSIWVSGGFWGGLAIWSVWRRPQSLFPIMALLGLLLLSFMLAVSGRGAIITFPFAAMRYYSDELITIGVFLALIVSHHVGKESFAKPRFLYLSLIGVLIYPIAAHLSDRVVFAKAYDQHLRAHTFMTNLQRSLDEVSQNENPVKILRTNFPSYAYGFLGARKPIADVWAPLYPRLKWVTAAQARGKVLRIDDNGRLVSAVLASSPVFTDELSFPDWFGPEDAHRWSRDYHSTILFSLKPGYLYEGRLVIKGPVLGTQNVTVKLNGTVVGEMSLVAREACCEWAVNFPPKLLIADGLNTFEFDLPDAHKPSNGDQRVLAIGVSEIDIR